MFGIQWNTHDPTLGLWNMEHCLVSWFCTMLDRSFLTGADIEDKWWSSSILISVLWCLRHLGYQSLNLFDQFSDGLSIMYVCFQQFQVFFNVHCTCNTHIILTSVWLSKFQHNIVNRFTINSVQRSLHHFYNNPGVVYLWANGSYIYIVVKYMFNLCCQCTLTWGCAFLVTGRLLLKQYSIGLVLFLYQQCHVLWLWLSYMY